MEQLIKTFEIGKKGRKYFDCRIGNLKAKLVINSVSEQCQPGTHADFVVADISKRSAYGTELVFNPLSVADPATAAAVRRAPRAEKWLGYAESDARSGLYSSNAIKEAFNLCDGLPQFDERIAALKEAIERNRDAHESQKLEWAREKEQQRREREAKKQERRNHRTLFPLSGLPPLNRPVRMHGGVVVYESCGKSFRISEDHPSCEGGHLLGHEGETGCYCYFRLATADEIAALEAAEAARQAAAEARKQRAAEIRRIAEHIQTTGERPDGMNEPTGERVIDTQTIYGGGDWFVIGQDHIWYVKNNGMDGDNWACNNVRTGGAGAIGWRIQFDQQIADELRRLAAQTAAA